MIDVSVIIVSWNTRELLGRCLKSLFEQTHGVSFEVFVVENASSDDSAEMVRSEFTQVNLIANDANLGFARANNQAIAEAKGECVLLLNPDTELIDDGISNLVAVARKHPEAGIVGGKILNPDRSIQASVRRFPTLCSQVLITLKFHHAFPDIPCLRRYFANDVNPESEQSADQVMGAFFLISRQALNIVGTLDERFFIWFEEVDYCKRVVNAGLKVLYTPVAQVVHHGGESFAQVFALKKQKMFNASLAKYMRKHFGRRAWLAIQILRPVSLLLAWFSGFVHG
ncbi:hypothetical protein A3D72_01400 [Candidatus Uhrbacteria bacterium RIFCSPHIGHO2_02_FULL_57_19]|uniref:Glycosyltransferase 2-like domain-containing protein n=1 Tax=Candidatus Uhrbacteria bacterium RIFCSPHIGHO2_02_FULL_57_19 TaxID=1802391 RepID=A0A1F7U390_9BACT|nr:MAG: hypothetical protein A3D72_01400 [Candidatus Uhrbacteria bacterium RIFCSPHIGHO2_02_FULL_57_19]